MRPLTPGVDAFLQGLPRAEAPGDLRTRLLAAHARQVGGPRSSLSLAWESGRAGLLAGAVTGSLAVVAFSGALSSSSELDRGGLRSSMVGAGPFPREVAYARVLIVDERLDPRTFVDVGAPTDGGP